MAAVKPTSTAAFKPKAPEPVEAVPRPTPTQEENDLAAAGVHVEVHEWDGTPLQNTHGKPDRPDLPELPPPSVAPVLSSVSPNSAVLGGPNFRVNLTGTGFLASSIIVFAGHDEPTTLESDGRLSTGVDMSVWHGPDTVPVSVRNGDKVSNTLTFTFTAAMKSQPTEAAKS
jgi:hypothetical protein